MADKALKKGAQAAGQSIGIPVAVTNKVLNSKIGVRMLKALRRTPIAILAVFALFGAAIFGGAIVQDSPEDEVWNVEATDSMGIPDPYLEAYRNAASAAKIPWTLLAAVGKRASNHGRTNPYEGNVAVALTPGVYNGGTKRVLHYGDSIGGGASPYLRSLFQQMGIEYQAKVENGKRIDKVLTEIDADMDSITGTGTVILLNVGNNDTEPAESFKTKIEDLAGDLPGTVSIYWVTVDFPTRPLTQVYNMAIRSISGSGGGNRNNPTADINVIEWESYAVTNNVRPVDDVHLGAAGYRLMAREIASGITGIDLGDGATNGEQPGAIAETTGRCPTLPEPIEGETRNQGAGPLMLKPAVLDAAGHVLGEDVQNICASAEALAEMIAEAARIVGEEQGLPFPSGIAELARTAAQGDAGAADRIHKFWGSVIDRTGVLGEVEKTECGFGERENVDPSVEVGVMINSYWRCHLNANTLIGVDRVSTDTTGKVSYTRIGTAETASRAVNEALSVAWTWSEWGARKCDNAAETAGIFPLTEATFQAHVPENLKDRDRCHWEANIAAAAEAYAVGEKTEPATRPGYWNATIGGWGNFSNVSGPSTSNFDSEGPWEPLSTSQTCARVIVNDLVAQVRGTELFPGRTAAAVQRYIADGVPVADQAATDSLIAGAVAEARLDPACTTTKTYENYEWYGALAGTINGDYLSVGENGLTTSGIPGITRGNTAVPRGIGDIVAVLGARAFTLGNVPAATVTDEVTAYLQRLSTERLDVPSRPALPQVDPNITLTVGSQIVNIAVGYYGGIFVNQSGQTIAVGVGLVGSDIPYGDLFNSIGRELGVDPRALAAIAQQESNFNAESGCPYNGSGAAGMMQKENDAVPTVCGDPARQIRVGAEMFVGLVSRAGDIRGALWGYNNGPVFANEWNKLGGDIDDAAEFAKKHYCSKPNWSGVNEDGQKRCEWRAEVAMRYISDDPAVRSAWGNFLRYQQLYPTTVINSFQTSVLGSDCPDGGVSQIPGKALLREGADTIGFKQLCVNSVAQAPTPEAARAIIFAFRNLGGIYDTSRRNQERFDCSGYVSKAYEYAGVLMHAREANMRNYFTTHRLLPHSWGTRPAWVVQVDPLVMQPGDLMFPFDGHVVMVLSDGFMAHSPATGDVNHVRKIYSTFKQVNRVVPELSPRPFEPLQVLN